MTVAMLMSKDRLEQEHAMFNRLVVGLLDNGNQVIRVVPEVETVSMPFYDNAVSFSKLVEQPMPVSLLLRKQRREEVIELCLKNDVTAIVAYGEDATQLAKDVAPSLDVKVMQEVVSMQDARKVKKSSIVWRWLAATPSIESEITRRVGTDRVALVPLGVTNHNVNNSNISNTNRCVVVLDAAGNPRNTSEILDSLKQFQNLHVFLEMTGKKQQRVWKTISQLEMHGSTTCLRDISSLRKLITQADLVVLPSKRMPVRTVFLEAMLGCIPIVATEIPGFDMLIDEESSFILKDGWQKTLSTALEENQISRMIGESGSKLVSEKYGSATQIAAFEAAFSLI
jgi:hypothetical protein